MPMKKIFISDIDNTLVPQKKAMDGKALEKLRERISASELLVAYASGRHLGLLLAGIEKHTLPKPDFLISRVGTVIHERKNGTWTVHSGYSAFIGRSWGGRDHAYIRKLLSDITELKEQEETAQDTHKQSYYLDMKYDKTEVIKKIRNVLNKTGCDSKVVYSIDQVKNVGLIDILPEKSGKGGAIRFLSEELLVPLANILYSGDSGNDIDAFTSGSKAVLVGNALPETRENVQKIRTNPQFEKNIYIAEKPFIAGVLEGLDFFSF